MFEDLRNTANKIILFAKKAELEQDKVKRRYILKQIEEQIQILENSFKEKTHKKISIDWLAKRQLLEELQLHEKDIQKIYTLEKRNASSKMYHSIANYFFEPASEKIVSLFPKQMSFFQKRLLESGLNILSLSYLSMSLLITVLLLFLGTVFGMVFFYTFSLWYSLFLGVLLSSLSLILFFFYPFYAAKRRKKELEQELPFFINHCAALAHAGVKGKSLFEILLSTSYYKAFHIDCRRILTYIDMFNKSLEQSLKQCGESNPSDKTKTFFYDFANALEEKKDVGIFLKEKAKESLTAYKKQNSFFQRYSNHWEDMHQIFSFKDYSFMMLFVVVGILTLYWYHSNIDTLFISIFAVGMFLLSIPFFLKMLLTLQARQREDKQFFFLLQGLKETKNLLTIEHDFKELQTHVQKLKNQYKIGIPRERAWESFAKDTKNPLIQATITMSLEAKKKGADLYVLLYELGTSKLLRKVLKN